MMPIQKPKKKGRPKKQVDKRELPKAEIIMKLSLGKKDIDNSKFNNIIVEKVEPISKDFTNFGNSEYINAKKEIIKKNEAIIKIKNEMKELQNKFDKHIGAKQDFIEMKTHCIHKDNKISVFEKNNNLACFHCTYLFDNDPIFIPSKYDKIKKIYYVFGNFCSFGCAVKYNIELGDRDIWNRNSLLISMFKDSAKLTGIEEYDNLTIPEAPPREALVKFGGYLDIDTFRKLSLINDRHYTFIQPYMSIKKSYIEDTHKMPELFDSLHEINKQLKALNIV